MVLTSFKTYAGGRQPDPADAGSRTRSPTYGLRPALRAARRHAGAALVPQPHARRHRCNAAAGLVTASMAAYALARMEFRGKKVVFGLIVGDAVRAAGHPDHPELPDRRHGWTGSTPCSRSSCPTAAGAFGVFFLRQFFLALPKELEEAAFLDGANQLADLH